MTAYENKLKDPRWQRKRLEILDRDDWACTGCGDESNTLHVHHKRYTKGSEPWEYEGEDLTTLCEECHDYAHGRREKTVVSVYCAGKVRMERGGDWRPEVAEILAHEEIPSSAKLYEDNKTIIRYVGPWVVSCDHGCYHGEGTHGVGAVDDLDGHGLARGCSEIQETRAETLSRSLEGISDADVVYVRLDDLTAYGTLVEIGYACALNKPFVFDVALDESDAEHLWFAIGAMKYDTLQPKYAELLRKAVGAI